MVIVKTNFRWYVWVIVLAGCVLAGTGCRSKKEKDMIASLRQQITIMQTEIDTLKTDLEQAQAKTASLGPVELSSDFTGRMLDDPNQNLELEQDIKAKALDVILKDAVAKIRQNEGISDEADELMLLKKENELLKNKLQQLRTELEKGVTSAVGLSGDKSQNAMRETETILKEWALRRSPVQQIDFINSLADLSLERDPGILPILEQALESSDPGVGLAASELLKEYMSSDVLPAVEIALLSSNEGVRLNALEPLSQINDPVVSDILGLALNDDSMNVRNKALDTVKLQKGNIQLNSLTVAMISEYDEVKTEALSLLELRGDRKAVPVIIEGLKDPSPEYREEVNSVLSFLVDHEFDTYDQAVQWWHNNEDRFDEDLFEK